VKINIINDIAFIISVDMTLYVLAAAAAASASDVYDVWKWQQTDIHFYAFYALCLVLSRQRRKLVRKSSRKKRNPLIALIKTRQLETRSSNSSSTCLLIKQPERKSLKIQTWKNFHL